MRLVQCKKCPWKKDTDPHEIPNGYCPTKHENLRNTLGEGFSWSGTTMACHEFPVGSERACAGWMAQQLGPGNNLRLRLWARNNVDDIELDGEQHETFEETLPD